MRRRLTNTALVLVTALIILLPLSTGLIVCAAEDGAIEIGGYIAAGSGNTIYCCITYDANGGTGSCIGTDIALGETDIVLSADDAGISRAGYNFTGWNTDEGGNGVAYASGDSLTLDANVTLYAQWTVAAAKKQASDQRKAGQISRSSISTGDESSITIWISVFGISLVLLITVWITHIRRKKAEKQSLKL